MKQLHSHPILRRPTEEKEPREPRDIVPVPDHPVNVPHSVAGKLAAIRRSESEIEYADPSVLEDIQSKAANITDRFPNKAILFVGAECYDAPTITVLQGLRALGFTVYTISKPNVNSWFCNEVVENTSGLKVDFVLSNVQWGVRWSHYSRYHLDRFPNVLIDGCDNHGDLAWRQKIDRVRHTWKKRPGQSILDQQIQPYQWGEPEGSYKPDLVFASQLFDGYDAVYLPFGIQQEYINLSKKVRKDITYAYVSGAGSARQRVERWLGESQIPDLRLEQGVRGQAVIPPEIAGFIAQDGGDPGVHSWFRWVHYSGYYDLLSKTKCLIYSNVWDDRHWWDSKRPWEALACGCLLMTEKPSIDMSGYPVTAISPFTMFRSQGELVDKANWLYEHPALLDRLIADSTRLAHEYFTPAPLARRFLYHIHSETA